MQQVVALESCFEEQQAVDYELFLRIHRSVQQAIALNRGQKNDKILVSQRFVVTNLLEPSNMFADNQALFADRTIRYPSF